MTVIRSALFAVLALFVLGGCATTKTAPAPSAATANAELIHGYSLLYELVSKQSNLDKVLIFKSVSEQTRRIIRQITETSGAAKQQLEELVKLDSALVLNDPGLPPFESSVRASIESATSRQLVFGGESFELRLLLTQTEATRYGAALARQLAQIDSDRARVSWLNSFAQQYDDLNREVVARLAVRTTPAAAPSGTPSP